VVQNTDLSGTDAEKQGVSPSRGGKCIKGWVGVNMPVQTRGENHMLGGRAVDSMWDEALPREG
jgi:hypothetical protein